jgi:hypothetical protein
MVDRNKNPPQLNIATYLANKASRSGRNKERRNRRAARYCFRHRSSQQTLEAVTAMGGMYQKVAGVLIKKAQDALDGRLPVKSSCRDKGFELAADC